MKLLMMFFLVLLCELFSENIYASSGRSIRRYSSDTFYEASGRAISRLIGDSLYYDSGRTIGRIKGSNKVIVLYFFSLLKQ